MSNLAQMYDKEFRQWGERRQGWGCVLLAAAGMIWLWLAYLLFLPFQLDSHRTSGDTCESRVFYDEGKNNASYRSAEGERCDRERDLAPMLAGLLVSIPLAAIGTSLYATGTATIRTSMYREKLEQLELEDVQSASASKPAWHRRASGTSAESGQEASEPGQAGSQAP
ncbi:hypothetical protein [Streptomyces bambusae]|uniref:Transmembrane protein n=1 Tax=Streptomyces bambusae TaxID=1550616 RepID=A0ABS6Z9H6_9ACTN|nr:hypothetical protein [Streptomyces bambusae]MBW5483381.1 hypothetical protein [Streptomyces bambusae]